MCEPTTMLMAATAVSAGGSIIGGQQRAGELNSQAGQVMAAGEDQARKIRRQSQADRGSAVAAMAASGVEIGQGSALETERQILTIGEEDAMMTLLGARQQASSLRRQASAEKVDGWLNATSTVLGGASKMPGWGGK
jgi:hypothetical protein